MTTYPSMDEWLDEIENYSTRRERLLNDLEDMDKEKLLDWVRTAWDLGFHAGRKNQLKNPF